MVRKQAAATQLQSAWRSAMARRRITSMHMAAVMIQKQLRMLREKRAFQSQRRAVKRLQKWVRAMAAVNRMRDVINNLTLIAKLQRAVRRWCKNRWDTAASRIQARVRGMQARQLVVKLRRERLLAAGLMVQKVFRGWKARRDFRALLRSRGLAMDIIAGTVHIVKRAADGRTSAASTGSDEAPSASGSSMRRVRSMRRGKSSRSMSSRSSSRRAMKRHGSSRRSATIAEGEEAEEEEEEEEE
eukprot:PLAT6460.23.p1 GENE.PLAT6460.23~~PLAT6460.23.p1  ORF type:complete len:266 (+),score=160.07 PLAT6460.23:72-800(+)